MPAVQDAVLRAVRQAGRANAMTFVKANRLSPADILAVAVLGCLRERRCDQGAHCD